MMAVICACAALNFYPRPPRGGRPAGAKPQRSVNYISIHALREEGDGVLLNE